jgi:hypothetical protein
MKIRNGWIFGERESRFSPKDILIFALPIIWGFFLTIYFDQNSLAFGRPGFIVSSVFLLFLDFPHAYSTFLKVGLDQKGLRRDYWFYLAMPVFCFLLVFSFASYSIAAAKSAIGYINMYHSLRQEYGWIMFSRRTAGEQDKLGLNLDKLMIYSLTFFTIIWLHTLPAQDAWWLFPNDLVFSLPVSIGLISQKIFWGISLFYVLAQLWKIKRGDPVNLAKFFILSMIGIAWYVGIVHYTGVTWMLDSLHAFAYIFFVFKYKNNIRSEEARVAPATPNPIAKYNNFYLYLILAACSYVSYRLYLTSNPWVFAILFVPSVSHYILDGFIWKFSKTNNDLSQVFGLKPAPRTL